MIRGLCESPLTFEAIMVWRDELREQKILLRDIIDLEATYGAEMGITPPSAPGVNADGLVDPEAAKIEIAEPSARSAASRRRRRRRRKPRPPPTAKRKTRRSAAEVPTAIASSTTKQAISMSAMEAELQRRRDGARSTPSPKRFGQFRKLQEKRIELRLQGKSLPGAQSEAYDDRAEHHHRRAEEAEAQQCADRKPGRAALRHQPQAHSA